MKKLIDAVIIIAAILVGLYCFFGAITRDESTPMGACDISGYTVVDCYGNTIDL